MPTPERRREPSGLAGAALAAAATALFLARWWNRYVGLSLDGYFPLYGRLIRGGQVPYRDFYLHLPPLQALAHAALETLPCPSLIAGRMAGAAGRVLLAALLALWLARLVRPAVAVLASVASVWLASGDDTEILDLYNHHALLAAIASGYLACRGLTAHRRSWLWWGASGTAAGIALLTKQTIGLGAAIAVPAALLLLSLRDREDRRRFLPRLTLYGTGWLLPCAAVGVLLAGHQALAPCLDQLFLDPAGSKGRPWELLVRVWVARFRIPDLVRPARLGALAALLLLLCNRPPAADPGAPGRHRGLAVAAAVALLALGTGVVLAYAAPLAPLALREIQRLGVFTAQFGVLGLSAILALAALRRFHGLVSWHHCDTTWLDKLFHGCGPR